MRKSLIATAMMTGLAIAGLSGQAKAEYPDKPVQFVVPWPPGGEEDVLTRIIAETFQSMYGQPAAVVNKPGGGGGPYPGAVEVALAANDGYTIGSFVVGVPVAGPSIGIDELNPDPFIPVGIFLTYPFLIAAHKDAPYNTLQELADYAKNNDVAYGHFGSGLVPTRATFGIAEKLGFEFSSDAPFDNLDCNVLASGDVDVMNSVVGLVAPCMDKLKVLATITEERLPLTPDSQTVSEVLPDINITLWNGLFVPKGTPADVIEKIQKAAMAALESPQAQEYAASVGAQIYWKNQDQATRQIKRDIKTFHSLPAGE